jgi:arylsulfate sulfotransferase
MTVSNKALWCLPLFLALHAPPAHATVTVVSVTPSPKSPQVIGTTITWAVTATDSNPGPLAFQFDVATPGKTFAMVKDFNVGAFSAGVWTAPPFVWTPTGIEGEYQVLVTIKDFSSRETATKVSKFIVNPLAGTSPAVVPTANPLVALFSSPSCTAGSMMRVQFHQQSQTQAFTTNWLACHPPNSMTFEIAGMYPTSTYRMYSQTSTAGKITNGPTLSFTTGALPTNVPFPAFEKLVAPGPQTDNADPIILHNPITVTGTTHYPDVATDLSGNILWYYYPNDTTNSNILTRPLPGGYLLTIEDGVAWDPAARYSQYLHQVDLAGNIVRETNTGIIQQELLAAGATDGGPCSTIPKPAPVGSACTGSFHHDAIQSLPHGYTAVIADIEKIFPAGTQGDTSGLPVDIVGDMLIVLDTNWQVVWFWDSFDYLDVNRAAVLGETCTDTPGTGCPPMLLLGSGIAPAAHDWLHGNSLYYWPQSKDLVFSLRHQDWVIKIDYQDGAGSKNILWHMGPSGDFTFNNTNNDPWPWFSHQHEVGIENNGAGSMSIFDNGNTRVSAPPLGLGNPGCKPSDCNSRGMALTVDETNMQVTPVMSVDLGVYAIAMGSAQLLGDGNYFFVPAFVLISLSAINSYSIEILPTPGTITGTQVLNLQGPEHYRAWQMPNLYSPPIT